MAVDGRGAPDERAFEQFVAAHERRLRQALTAVLGLDHGRDAAADALAYAWEHWHRVAAMGNPAGYLFVVGRDRQRHRLRTLRRHVRADIPATPSEPWCEPALAAELDKLTDKERTVVLLIGAFEWTYGEVAELLDLSKSTVQTHVERGMAKLRTALGVTA